MTEGVTCRGISDAEVKPTLTSINGDTDIEKIPAGASGAYNILYQCQEDIRLCFNPDDTTRDCINSVTTSTLARTIEAVSEDVVNPRFIGEIPSDLWISKFNNPIRNPGLTCTDLIDGLITTTVLSTPTDKLSPEETLGAITANTTLAGAEGQLPVKYTCRDAAGNNATTTITYTVDNTNPIVRLPSESAAHTAGTQYEYTGPVDCIDADPQYFITDDSFKLRQLEPDKDDGPIRVFNDIPGDYTITYTCTDRAGNKDTADLDVTIFEAGAPHILVTGNGRTIERLSTDVPTARCIKDGVTEPLQPKSVEPAFDANAIFSPETRSIKYTYTFECVDEKTSEKVVTLFQVSDLPVLEISGYEHESGVETDSSKLANLHVTGRPYASDGTCSQLSIGELKFHSLFPRINPEITVVGITTDTALGTHDVTYTCTIPNTEKSVELIRKVTVVDRLVPRINLGNVPTNHTVGTDYVDKAACDGTTPDSDTTIKYNATSGDTFFLEITAATPPGEYNVTYSCTEELFGATLEAEQTSKILGVMGKPSFIFAANNTKIVNGVSLPEATCTDTNGKIKEVRSTIKPAFNENPTFSFDKRSIKYTISFVCGDPGNRVKSTGFITQISATPIIKIPGYKHEGGVETTFSQKSNLHLNGTDYTHDVKCYQDEIDEVDFSSSNIVLGGTLDTDTVGTYPTTYTCTANGESTTVSRIISVVERLRPVLVLRDVHTHIAGTEYDDKASCKGTGLPGAETTTAYTFSIDDTEHTEITSATPTGKYKLDYTCAESILGTESLKGIPKSKNVNVITAPKPLHIVFESNNTLIEKGTNLPGAKCVDEVNNVNKRATLVSSDPAFTKNTKFTFEKRFNNYTLTFSCTVGDNTIQKLGYIDQADDRASIKINTYEKKRNGQLTTDTLLNNRHVLNTPYVDKGAKCFYHEGGERDLRQYTRHTLNKIGPVTVGYECRGGGFNTDVKRIIEVVYRLNPEIVFEGDTIMHTKGTTFTDDAQCLDTTGNMTISHKSSIIISGRATSIGENTPVGEYAITYKCEEAFKNRILSGTAQRTLDVQPMPRAPGVSYIVITGINKQLLDNSRDVPTAVCIDGSDATSHDISSTGVVTPAFKDNAKFKFGKDNVHSIEFECTDKAGTSFKESAAFTRVKSIGVIKLPGWQFDSDTLESLKSQQKNVHVAGEPYADNISCYHYTFGLVRLSTTDNPTGLTSRTPVVTADTLPGEYTIQYTCSGDNLNRVVTVVVREEPIITETDPCYPHCRNCI